MADRNGYIGRAPGDSSVIVARQTFTPSGVTTNFTFASGYDPGYMDCYLNGIRLIVGSDYTAQNGSTVGLTSFAQSGDVVELVAYKAFNLASVTDASGNFTVGNKLTVSGISSLTDVVSSGIVTADSFSGGWSGALSITDSTASTSTTTGALIVSGGVGIAKSLFVGEGLSVGGTITYDDVTNIDSIGIVTAGKGFRATTGGIIVTAGVSTFSNHIIVGTGLSIAGVTTSHKARLGVVGASGTSLHVHGDARVTGVITATSFSGTVQASDVSGTVSAATTAAVPGIATGGHTVLTTVNVSGVSTLATSNITTVNVGGGITLTASGIVNAGFTTITGATETVTGVTTYPVPDSSNTKVTIECDASKGTLFSHDMSNGNVGIVSLTSLPVRGNSFSTYTILFTQISSTPVGTGNTLPKNGIGTNVYLDGGFTGFSTRGRVATASTVTLSTTASDIDIVTFGVHYNGSGTAGKENFKVLVTSNTGYRVGND